METIRKCDGSQNTRAVRVQLPANLVYFGIILLSQGKSGKWLISVLLI
jgi:hypothetical protein